MTKPKFNWRTALTRAVKKSPSPTAQVRLANRAGEWTSCACGQLDPRLERFDCGGPADLKLRELGLQFNIGVRIGFYADALITLDKIEAREAALLGRIK